jgi:PIN domain nuclease of toxin-antitoxin system
LKILLDTCAFLWLSSDSPKATARIRTAFEDRSNVIYLSASSAWEISIKHSLGQLDLPEQPDRYIPSRIEIYQLTLLDMTLTHAIRAGGLPIHHKDPFDRMIIAQAQIEGFAVATPDTAFDAYDVDLFW